MDADTEASAPAEIRWCSRCRAGMVTRTVGGKARRACPECGHVHFVESKVGVGVSVVSGGRILLVRRRGAPGKGLWSVPAGYLDDGDHPEAHAVREVVEETGLTVRLTGLLGVFHNPPADGGASVFILYAGEVTGGVLVAGDDADDAAFFSADELPPLAFESTRHAVRRLGGDARGHR